MDTVFSCNQSSPKLGNVQLGCLCTRLSGILWEVLKPAVTNSPLQVEEGGLSNIPNTVFMRLIISYCRSKSPSVVPHQTDQEKRRQIPVLLYSHHGRKRKAVKEAW